MQNMMADLSETIGLKMIPMQAKLAEFWLKVIPVIEPIILGFFDAIIGGLEALGEMAGPDSPPLTISRRNRMSKPPLRTFWLP